MERKLKSMLSLCQKAGFLASGEENCERALQSGSAKLVFVCTDASDNTKKKFSQKTFYYNVPFMSIFTKTELTEATGKDNRSVTAVTNQGFAQRISEHAEVHNA